MKSLKIYSGGWWETRLVIIEEYRKRVYFKKFTEEVHVGKAIKAQELCSTRRFLI